MDNRGISVSVIIPCYNCEKWIRKCITALEGQTRKDFEVICINDCSTDNTKSVIENITEETSLNIKVLTNHTNMGPANSRNKAIEVAEGELIAFCDSDDWYETDFIEKMIQKIELDNSDIVMCEYRKVFESGKKSEEVHYLSCLSNRADINTCIVYSKASLCLLMIRKKLFNGIRIPDLRNGEDIAFVPCIESLASRISTIKEPLYNYLIREQSASNNINNKKVYKSLLEAFAYTSKNIDHKYSNELEFLGVRNVMYGVILNAVKVRESRRVIKDIISQFELSYPNWSENSYILSMSFPKRVFIYCVKKRLLFACRLFSILHGKISV